MKDKEDLNYWKANAEEDYLHTPISVLRYITELETAVENCSIPDVGKRKHWYRTDIYGCVLCGKEKIDRQRVYDEDKKGTHWHDDACSGHF